MSDVAQIFSSLLLCSYLMTINTSADENIPPSHACRHMQLLSTDYCIWHK